MSKKPKKKGHKNTKPAKKQTAAQQKKAARASAKKSAKKESSRKSQLMQLGYKEKMAKRLARSKATAAAKIHAERVKNISSKFKNVNQIDDILDKYFPKRSYVSNELAELIAQGRYEEQRDEYYDELTKLRNALEKKRQTLTGRALEELEGDINALDILFKQLFTR